MEVASKPSFSINGTSSSRKVYRQLPTPLILNVSRATVSAVGKERIQIVDN